MTKKFIVVIEKDENGLFIAKVPDLPGCHTQAKTIPSLLERVKEAIELCLEVKKIQHEKISTAEFVGIQQIELAG